MPYRRVRLVTGEKSETFLARVSDQAVIAWLSERHYLRSRGYPDRPPDCDSATVRLWLQHDGEALLPYFRERAAEAALGGTFPVCTLVWHAADGSGAKVIITGLADGSLLSRVILEDPAGRRTVDKAHRYGPDEDPDEVWDAVTTIIAFINAAGHWEGEALVTDVVDFTELEAEVEAARADARAVGLMTERKAGRLVASG